VHHAWEAIMQADILSDEQYKTLSKKLLRTVGNHYKIVPLNTLKNTHYSLARPIYITIEIEKDTVIASLDDIEAFAYADTEFEAINGLCQEIIDIYEDLKADRKNLGVLPKKWLEYLEDVIKSKGVN
jgi:hypothetical protein